MAARRDGCRPGGGCLGRGDIKELAVEPRAQNGVGRRAAQSTGEPGQVPSAQGDGDGSLHYRYQPVHEQPGGEDADDQGGDACRVQGRKALGADGVEEPGRVGGPALFDPEVVHQHDSAPGCHPGDEADQPGVEYGGEVFLEDEEDDGGEREDADEQVQFAAADGDVQRLRGHGEGVDVQDVGRDRAVQHHEQDGKGKCAEVLHNEFPGVDFTGVGGQAGPQDAQPDDGDELAQHRGEVDLALGHRGADEAGVVGGVGEPGDAPADADGGHDGAHRGDAFRALQDVAGGAGVGPVDLHAEPGDGRHHGRMRMVGGTVHFSKAAMAL